MISLSYQSETGTGVAPGVRAGRLWEIWYPWILGGAAAAAVWYFDPPPNAVYAGIRNALDSAVDASAVLAGFQATALSLLLTLVNSKPVRTLQEVGAYRPLVRFHWHAILILAFCVLFAMALLVAQGVVQTFGSWSRAIAAATVGTATAAGLCSLRVTWLMVKLLTRHDFRNVS